MAGRADRPQPGDINQDGSTDIGDATTFDEEWNGQRRAALLDINGDGKVTIEDATAFGASWNGGWADTSLPAKP